jgi:hypothetical protein
MTLRDLLKTCRYKDVFNFIYQKHYKDTHPKDKIQEADCGYRRVFEELLMLPDKPSEEYQIHIYKKTDNLYGEEFIDVGLYCNKDEETYAIDLTPWTDLIDAKIKTPTKLDDVEVVACILWEVTFYGFSEERITLERDELKRLIERIDSGEEKLIPWEDIEKELGSDDEA